MNQLDRYYRALLEYRANTDDRDCARFRKALTEAGRDSDSIRVKRWICRIEEDWIDEIEKGLVFIEKAIKEERQFIYSNGEVLPIEKVKNVSRDSVEHLAKHSDLITREPEGDDIIPDKLYSVERLNDYAVYENRFLYMLLCYLRDFISIRYDKILELTGKYEGELKLSKQVTLPSHELSISVELHDERRNDRYIMEHNTAKSAIDRIDLILKAVIAFLATPLMEYAAKAPMLKPPITKTNVLKMDNNFKGAVALYEYIVAYDKKGYTAEQRDDLLRPLSNTVADEISEASALLTFLTYEHGLGIGQELKRVYDEEKQRKQQERIKKQDERLEALRRKLDAKEISPEEYILGLEDQLKLMRSENASLEGLRRETGELKRERETLRMNIRELEGDKATLAEQVADMEKIYDVKLEDQRQQYEERISQELESHRNELDRVQNECVERIEGARRQMRDTENEARAAVSDAKQKLAQSEARYTELEASASRLAEEKLMCEASLTALRAEQGLIGKDEDMSDKQSIDRLEREFEAFLRLYESSWASAKKSIRKKILNYNNLKAQQSSDEE